MLAVLVSSALMSQSGLFDSCFSTHEKLKSGAVKLEVSQVLRGATTRTTYDLKFKLPSQLWMRIIEPEQNGRGASDRTFFVDGGQIFGYDAVVNEKLSRKAIPVGGLAQKFSLTIGQMDDAVACLIEPARLKAFLKPFRDARDWGRAAAKTGVVEITRTGGKGGKANSTVFQFDAFNGLLRRMEIGIPEGRLTWKLSYGSPPAKVGWRPPATAASVGSFTLRPSSARYASAEAKRIAERSMSVYDRLRHVSFRIEGAGGGVRGWISGDRIREDGPQISYVWDRKTASIRDARAKTFYSGKAGTAGIIDALARLGGRMDPMVRQIATRQNPMRVMLISGVSVRHLGSISLGGVAGEILEFQNSSARVSMVVRKDNGLLHSVRTEIYDPEGRMVSLAEKTYQYGSVGKAIPATAFKLDAPKGYKSAPISNLTKRAKSD